MTTSSSSTGCAADVFTEQSIPPQAARNLHNRIHEDLTQRSGEEEFQVGYLAAKQQPCCDEYPIFDIGLSDNYDDCFFPWDKNSEHPDRVYHEVYDHRMLLSDLYLKLEEQTNKARAQIKDEASPKVRQSLRQWRRTIKGLQRKVDNWEGESLNLIDDIKDWLEYREMKRLLALP